MSTWIPIVALIVAVLFFGAFVERRRVKALESWASAKGFELLVPFTPRDADPIVTFARRFNAHGARRWGTALTGQIAGVDFIAAEHETSRAGSTTKNNWYTVIQFPVEGNSAPIVLWPNVGSLPPSDARVADRLDVPEAEGKNLRTVTDGGLLVETVAADGVEQLSRAQCEALERWPHGGAVACEDGRAAWRVNGTLNASKLENLLPAVSALREILRAD